MDNIALELDTGGLTCPLPILRTKKALATLASGQIVCVRTTDPHALGDFQDFCRQTQHQLLKQETMSDGALKHYICKR